MPDSIHGFDGQDFRAMIRILQAVRALEKRAKRCCSHLEPTQKHDSKGINHNRGIVILTQPGFYTELTTLVQNTVWGLALESWPLMVFTKPVLSSSVAAGAFFPKQCLH